jgi:hypothetical protein
VQGEDVRDHEEADEDNFNLNKQPPRLVTLQQVVAHVKALITFVTNQPTMFDGIIRNVVGMCCQQAQQHGGQQFWPLLAN